MTPNFRVHLVSKESKLRGFRVFVEGRALNDFEVELIFRKVRLLRRSRFLPEITIPLPGAFIRRNASDDRSLEL